MLRQRIITCLIFATQNSCQTWQFRPPVCLSHTKRLNMSAFYSRPNATILSDIVAKFWQTSYIGKINELRVSWKMHEVVRSGLHSTLHHNQHIQLPNVQALLQLRRHVRPSVDLSVCLSRVDRITKCSQTNSRRTILIRFVVFHNYRTSRAKFKKFYRGGIQPPSQSLLRVMVTPSPHIRP